MCVTRAKDDASAIAWDEAIEIGHSRAAMSLAAFIYRNTNWLLIPIVLLLLFPSPWMSIGFGADLGLYFSRWIAKGNPFPVSSSNLPILILLVMMAVGLVLSPAPDLAVLTAAQVIASVTIFFTLIDRIHSAYSLWRSAALLVFLGLLLALAAPLTVKWASDKLFDFPAFYDQPWPRLAKVTNPNILGGALALIAPIVFALIRQERRAWRILGVVALIPILLVLILLQSRGALFALAVGLGVWVSLYRRWLLPLLPILLLSVFYLNNAFGGPPWLNSFTARLGLPPAEHFFSVKICGFKRCISSVNHPLWALGWAPTLGLLLWLGRIRLRTPA